MRLDYSILPESKWPERKFVPLIVIILAFVIGATLWFAHRIELQKKKDVAESLETVLLTTDGALRAWDKDLEADSLALAKSEEIQKEIGRLIRERKLKSAQLEHILSPYIREHRYIAFKVFDLDENQIAPRLRTGDRKETKEELETVGNALKGRFTRSNPYFLKSKLHNLTGATVPHTVMILAVPIQNASQKTIAALAFYLDPATGLTSMTQIGRIGYTGETYAVDRSGRMITQSRYNEELYRAGIIPSPKLGISLIEIRNPGGDMTKGFKPKVSRESMTLTRAAKGIVESSSGIDLNGYLDYRGVKVVGAWTWDEELGFGLVTELDVWEAYRSLHMIRNLTWAMIGVIVVGGIFILLIFRSEAKARQMSYANEQANRARRELMAIVTHDLRNPLTSILMTDDLLLKTLPSGEVMQRRKKFLETMRRSAEQMKRLIDDLQLSAKSEIGKLSIRAEQVPIETLIGQAVKMFEPLASEKRISLKAQFEIGLPDAWCDQERVQQVFSNLVGNALKFTPEGGMITLRASAQKNEIVFSVVDTGAGISADELNRVFEKYWQTQDSAKTGKGLGLGLAIAKEIVESHGGKIWVESVAGRGTTFSFSVPVIRPKVGAATQEASL